MFSRLVGDFPSNLLIKKEHEAEVDRIIEQLYDIYPMDEDPWGMRIERVAASFRQVWPLYKYFFRVRVLGAENAVDGPSLIVSNHSGQIALDGMLLTEAFASEVAPPRVIRAMVERFFVGLPFLGTWAAESGAVLGDRSNCIELLRRGNSVLVFPEGVRGVSKSSSDYYKIQPFSRGFFRMALQSECSILPVAVIGAEEFYPYVYQFKRVAKMLGLPALPVSPLFPLLGPLGALPLPSPVDIHIGEPYNMPKNLSPDAPDKIIDEHVYEIENTIRRMIRQGLRKRRPFWFNKKVKV
jgi:1-acyl-sn-glycerol-3-phosphate acyltransferase